MGPNKKTEMLTQTHRNVKAEAEMREMHLKVKEREGNHWKWEEGRFVSRDFSLNFRLLASRNVRKLISVV